MNFKMVIGLVAVIWLVGCKSTVEIEQYHAVVEYNPKFSEELNMLIAAEQFDSEDLEAIMNAKLSYDRGEKATTLGGVGRLFSTISLWNITNGASMSLLGFDGSRKAKDQHYISAAIIDTQIDRINQTWQSEIKDTIAKITFDVLGKEGKFVSESHRHHSGRWVDYFAVTSGSPEFTWYSSMQNFFTVEFDKKSFGVVKSFGAKSMNSPKYSNALKDLTNDGQYIIYMPFVFNKDNICTRAGFLYRNGKKDNVPEFEGMCES